MDGAVRRALVWRRAACGDPAVREGLTAWRLKHASNANGLGGAPDCCANGVYCASAPGPGYAVVASPSGAEAAQPLPDPIIYPRNGQTVAQTEADQVECKRWATTQPSAMADASVFQRAVAACLDGRGYTVR